MKIYGVAMAQYTPQSCLNILLCKGVIDGGQNILLATREPYMSCKGHLSSFVVISTTTILPRDLEMVYSTDRPPPRVSISPRYLHKR